MPIHNCENLHAFPPLHETQRVAADLGYCKVALMKLSRSSIVSSSRSVFAKRDSNSRRTSYGGLIRPFVIEDERHVQLHWVRCRNRVEERTEFAVALTLV